MISWIKGEFVSTWQANNKFFILINCHGLGYEIQTLESVILEIKTNKISKNEVILWLKHIKKEDSDMLFGFTSRNQRDFFVQILNIKGIGSQIGMSLLNKFSLNQIFKAISNNDKKSISSVQGIGQKMTERIFLELKSKIATHQIEERNKDNLNFLLENQEIDSLIGDIDLTLQSLNYSKKEIKKLLPELIKEIKNNQKLNLKKENISFEYLLKEAMNHLDNK